MNRHPNSIDKTRDGNYLVSGRHTSTIYLISGNDSSVIWRLGGKNSSFAQDSFIFSRQHDARIRSEDSEGMVISFLDNAFAVGVGGGPTATSSSVVVVALKTSTSPMTATVIERIAAPEGTTLPHAGNAQFLDNGNRLVNWVEGSRIIEHDTSGEVVYEARWSTQRYRTYRAYKGNFVAQPKELPAIRSFASTTSNGHLATTVYVSWNGATEVKSWRVRDAANTIIAETTKTGFETTVVCQGYHSAIVVEAVDMQGRTLSRSDARITELPPSWSSSFVSSQKGTIGLSVFTLLVAFVLGALCREFYSRWIYKSRLYNMLYVSRLGYSKVDQTTDFRADIE